LAIDDVWLAGVDGCRVGWVAAFVRPQGQEVRVRMMLEFGSIFSAPETPAIVAVDMPIGLPERTGLGGRKAETVVRPLLGARQSSVFSVPARAAIYAADFGEACRLALAASDPPRKVSMQLFNIAAKIREVDTFLRGNPVMASRAYEVHPELAFWRLNGGCALAEPKKIKSRAYHPGLALRRRLLIEGGFAGEVVVAAPPKGAAADDLIDALACAAVARRIYSGLAQSFPDPPERDKFGLPMAIWA
jgi:predicted RNase H-like nuclease